MDENKSKMKKNDSVILSWSYRDDDKGTVVLGRKDPLGITQRIEIMDVFIDETGLKILRELGIELA